MCLFPLFIRESFKIPACLLLCQNSPHKYHQYTQIWQHCTWTHHYELLTVKSSKNLKLQIMATLLQEYDASRQFECEKKMNSVKLKLITVVSSLQDSAVSA